MKPYEHNGIVGYSKQQALAIIGCSQLADVATLITKGKLEVVGLMPLPHMPYIKRKLLSVESVELYAENFLPRPYGTHMYQFGISPEQLQDVKVAFPQLTFCDLTQVRRIRLNTNTHYLGAHDAHMYQVRMSCAQLRAVQGKFPQLPFTDLTESRRIKREEL